MHYTGRFWGWALVGLAALCAAPTFAEPRILSAYSRGSNYYYNPRSGGGPSGYSGPGGGINRVSQPKASQPALFANNRRIIYAAPCGNFNRVKPRHCPPTKAWDSSFNSPYSLTR